MSEAKVQKEAAEEFGPYEVKFEGLEDGYRVTVRGDKEKVKSQRRVGASFINFLRQAEKAGWPIPFPFRLLLKFWGNYNSKGVKGA
ncbi:MAG: hypothetical protein LPK26_14550 [Bacillaceae bacterium]|nr:hypothetical protein [Bacillaceae bacterium]